MASFYLTETLSFHLPDNFEDVQKMNDAKSKWSLPLPGFSLFRKCLRPVRSEEAETVQLEALRAPEQSQ